MGLKLGTKAPAFRLADKDGQPISLVDQKAAFTVVYFYPKDDTPGCTIEAKEFSKALAEFKARDAEVIGISGGDVKSKSKFCQKYDLEVRLLSDPDFRVSKAYGAYGQKQFMGRTFMGIQRTTFILDKSKRIVHTFPTVKAEGHAHEVLRVIDKLKNGGMIQESLLLFDPTNSNKPARVKKGKSRKLRTTTSRKSAPKKSKAKKRSKKSTTSR